MHIAVYGDVDAGMVQNLAQRLYVKSEANAVRGERVSEAVEIHGRNAAFFESLLIELPFSSQELFTVQLKKYGIILPQAASKRNRF